MPSKRRGRAQGPAQSWLGLEDPSSPSESGDELDYKPGDDSADSSSESVQEVPRAPPVWQGRPGLRRNGKLGMGETVGGGERGKEGAGAGEMRAMGGVEDVGKEGGLVGDGGGGKGGDGGGGEDGGDGAGVHASDDDSSSVEMLEPPMPKRARRERSERGKGGGGWARGGQVGSGRGRGRTAVGARSCACDVIHRCCVRLSGCCDAGGQ